MGTILGAMLCSGLKNLKKLEEIVLNFDYKILKKTKPFYFFRQLKYPYARNQTPDFSGVMKSLIGEDSMLGEMKTLSGSIRPHFTAATLWVFSRYLILDKNLILRQNPLK